MTDIFWQLKLAARIHDPAEKALVLYRDPSGHTGGSIVGIGKALGFPTRTIHRTLSDGSTREEERLNLDEETQRIVQQADHWAAAADRPQFPKDTNERFPDWAQVRFAREGKLIHPLTGQEYDLPNIEEDVLADHIKTVSQSLFIDLIHKNGDTVDHRQTHLAFWRYGPELGQKPEGIGHLWSLLPADTRVPDHTIWQHLDLTSALAGAMTNHETPSLLTVSLGPVQDFIAAGRSTSDLWAGSHFLSMLAWQAMKVIAESLGPDAILFPQLRGVPVVDLWLVEQGVKPELFERYRPEWMQSQTDYNPLFGAVLPNKFVALVPDSRGQDLAKQIEETVRTWVQHEARRMLDMVLTEIGESPNGQHCYRQLEEQLNGFPEVHWSLVPWAPEREMKEALHAFFPQGKEAEFFTGVWSKLRTSIEPEAGWTFWKPNDGTLYPAVHDCAERLLAAAKAVRAFEQLGQDGYRDSLTGEYEWLTLDKRELLIPRGQRANTIWTRLAERKPSWVKKGEHLSANGLLKRLWPACYVEWLKGQNMRIELEPSRYVISTHVMALAPSLEKLMKDGPEDEDKFRALSAQTQGFDRAAMPRRLMRQQYRAHAEWWEVATRLPTMIDELREKVETEQEEDQLGHIRKTVEATIGIEAENYYALLLMDGDRLGAWLSGENSLKFRDTFHAKVRRELESYRDQRLRTYLDLRRPSSPARHMAISAALNGFSLDLVRYVIEDVCLGKLLYSGGDDVMAMVCVRDLLKALWLLRLLYSGGMPGEAGGAGTEWDGDPDIRNLKVKRGFVLAKNKNRLYRVMGERATASVGAVIAHHTAPLGMVLRHLREAEQDAKQIGGRNAYSLRLLKRAGGRLDLTLPWWHCENEDALSTMHALETLRRAIAEDLSRRAAYHADEWLRQLPLLEEPSQLKELIACNLAYQFKRKARNSSSDPRKAEPLKAQKVAAIAVREAERRLGTKDSDDRRTLAHFAYDMVRGMLFTAEFLAREARGGEITKQPHEEVVHG